MVLASQSKYRQALMHRLGLNFKSYAANVNESKKEDESGKVLASRLAFEKAELISQKYESDIVIGSDQVCILDETIIGKPGNFENAFKQLSNCSSKKVVFYTALCVLDQSSGQVYESLDVTEVVFRHLKDEEIRCYLNLDKPYDCAGSFKVESLGPTLFKEIITHDPTALIGLPMIKLCGFLRILGVNPLTA